MILKDEYNYVQIKTLVENHFALDSNSLEIFNSRLQNKNYMDQTILDFFKGSDDGRVYIKISKEEEEKNGISWKRFRDAVPENFKKKFNLKYSNYISGKVVYKKNELKIAKALRIYFDELRDKDEEKFIIEYTVFYQASKGAENCSWSSSRNLDVRNRIGSLYKNMSYALERFSANKTKGGDVDLYAVLSINFADWFLCSTGENWSSCLNMNNEYSYWTGLPGLLGDPNRVMIYITAKEKKTFHGITVDKVLSRTWAELDAKDMFHHLRWYPSKLFNNDMVKKALNINFPKYREHEWRSKNPIEPIFNERKQTLFPFQDLSMFDSNYPYNEIYVTGNDEGGFYYYDLEEYSTFNYLGDENELYNLTGLGALICSNSSVIEYCEDVYKCSECSDTYHFLENMHEHEGSFYCGYCYDSIFTTCSECGKTIESRFSCYLNNSDDPLCDDCFEEIQAERAEAEAEAEAEEAV